MVLSSFLEALSKIGLIKVKVDKSTKIIFQGDYISIGDQEIKDPKERLEFVSKLKEILKNYKNEESLPCQIIHKDLVQGYEQYESIFKKNSKSLSMLKEVLPIEEVECILMARRIQLAYQENDTSLIAELEKQLEKNYPRKGRKVANLIKAGYFDELIIPMIEICKTQHGDKYKERFREFYFNLLKFFPTAIFVNNETTEDVIEKLIEKRLKLKTIPMIRIHSIGKENIKKVENILEKIKERGKFNIADNRFTTPNGIEAQNLEIRINKNYS